MSNISELLKTYIDEKREKELQALEKKFNKGDLEQNEYYLKVSAIHDKFSYSTYIKARAQDAESVDLGTHVSKFIHSATKTSSFVAQKGQTHASIVDTDSLNNIVYDYYCNAAISPTGEILTLKDTDADKFFFEYVAEDDISVFDSIDLDDTQKHELCMLYKRCVDKNSDFITDQLVKNIFFKTDDTYKTLIPLFGSSLYHEIHSKISMAKDIAFAKKGSYEAFKNNKEHTDEYIVFPNLAIIKVGGANAQNVSRLNSVRNGSVKLLCCAPPSIELNKIKLYGRENIFHERSFTSNFRHQIRQLSKYLFATRGKSYNESMREQRAELIIDIVEIVCFCLNYFKETNSEGWTDISPLHDHFKVFIDKKYDKLNSTDYLVSLKELSKDFAYYCVNNIEFMFKNQYSLGDEKEYIYSLFERKLISFIQETK